MPPKTMHNSIRSKELDPALRIRLPAGDDVSKIDTPTCGHTAFRSRSSDEHASSRGRSEPRLEQVVREYEKAALAGQAAAMDAFFRRCVERWLHRWRAVPLTALVPRQLQCYVAELVHKEFDEVEVRRERSLVSFFFDWARRQGLTAADPSAGLSSLRARPRLPTVGWSVEEQKALFAACSAPPAATGPRVPFNGGFAGAERPPEYLRPLVLVGLRSGLSLGTILYLEWRHIKFLARRLVIPAAEMRSGRLLDVPLHREVLEVFQELVRRTARLGRKPARVFETAGVPTRGGIPDYDTVESHFRGACRRAGIRAGDFRSLRHTFAVQCAATGVPFLKAACLADWEDMNFLIQVYQEEAARTERRRAAQSAAWYP
jgi:integrase